MRKKAIFWVIGQIRNRMPAILLMTGAQIGYALLGVLFALGSRNVIDCAAAGDSQLFLQACLWQLSIVLGILLCMTVARYLKERLHAELERDWKRKLLHNMLIGDYRKVSSFHSGELVNRLNQDVNKVNEGILNILPAAAAMITRLVAAVLVLGFLDMGFMLLILTLGMVAIVLTAMVRRKLKNLNKRVSEHDGRVSGFLQESMEKLLVIQAMDVSGEVERRADGLLKQRYEVQRKRKNISVCANTGVSVMFYGTGFVSLVWCAGQVLQGGMTFGSLTAVIQLVNQLQRPFTELTGILPQYAALIAAAERLMELEQVQQTLPEAQPTDRIYRQMDAISAERLSFAYEQEQVLKEASFALPKGSFTVVTGDSGTGKSTLLKLLLGVFQPDEGSLTVDCGGEKTPLNLGTRRLFSYVPQGNLLWSGTLRENLTVVKPDATEAEIRQALHTAGVDTFIDQLPLGLETVLGENGSGLSEGQAQRVAIARAVLGGAPILLLDECTSALDEKMEQTVLQRLRALPDRTCIAVTHRPAALAYCDWKLRVEAGKVFVERPCR